MKTLYGQSFVLALVLPASSNIIMSYPRAMGGSRRRFCSMFVQQCSQAPARQHVTTGASQLSDLSALAPFARTFHSPVMPKEVVQWLLTNMDGVYLDGTLGGGGHSEAMLSRLSQSGRVVAMDQDPHALAFSRRRLAAQTEQGRFVAFQANFRVAQEALLAGGIMPATGFCGMLLDLGLSSHQLNEASRGFSFRSDGPLDMRMQGFDSTGMSAAHIVNTWDEGSLGRLLKAFGEEPRARKLARVILASRPIQSTRQLRELIEHHVPYGDRNKTLARVFQALRIAVNDEIDALEAVLGQATDLVRPGGRLLVLSYHSLEDRPVKRFMRTGNVEGKACRDFWGNNLSCWRPLTRHSLRPSAEEVEVNGRARSASLRVAERTQWTPEEVQERSKGPAEMQVEDILTAKEKRRNWKG